MTTVTIHNIPVGDGSPLALIAGPCVIESEAVVMRIAEQIKRIVDTVQIPWIFKSSYLKDNRSSATSYQGPGIREGLRILQKVKETFQVPVLSDIHDQHDAEQCADVLDIIQIPAFLSMQTTLLLAVGKTGRVVNVKKGQFLHPLDMRNVVQKLEYAGTTNILLTERGSCFGYRQLVADMRSLVMMRSLGYPVVFDPTHTVRNYGISSSEASGGNPEFVPALMRAGVAAGIDVLFIETHDKLEEAKCDAASMLPIAHLQDLLFEMKAIDALVTQKASAP